jgi:hypothetical protein
MKKKMAIQVCLILIVSANNYLCCADPEGKQGAPRESRKRKLSQQPDVATQRFIDPSPAAVKEGCVEYLQRAAQAENFKPISQQGPIRDPLSERMVDKSALAAWSKKVALKTKQQKAQNGEAIPPEILQWREGINAAFLQERSAAAERRAQKAKNPCLAGSHQSEPYDPAVSARVIAFLKKVYRTEGSD